MFLFLPGVTVLCPGVTLPTELPTHRVDSRLMWKGGVGTDKEIPVQDNDNILKARTLVLRDKAKHACHRVSRCLVS